MAVLVSGFLSNVSSPYKNDELYAEQGRVLVAAPVSKIIFLEKEFAEKHHFENTDYTRIIFVEKKDIYFWQQEWATKNCK